MLITRFGFNNNLIIILSSLLLIFSRIECFNLDVVNYIRHEGQPDSMFGFSVAMHQESQRSWIIIGSPTADTSSIQEGVHRGGAVYRCDISDDNRCQIIEFDSYGNNYNDRHEQIDSKSEQWFGATVASAGIDGPLVACAPRYVYHQHNPKKAERREPVGTCFIAKDNFRTFQEYSPCRTMYWGYHRQGSCQAGLSAAVNKDGDRLFVGAPGSWYWQGQIYSHSLNNPKDKVYSTKESTSQEDDSYLGYSSTTGDFNGDGTQGVAVGMPRGGGLLGKVLIFSWNLTNQQNITGEQIGSYFGYSLCSIDVDGDKLDDLIIGAPMYTSENNEGKYENGMIYIMYQGKYNKFLETDTREGTNSRARFGLSLAALGDINQDGYGDFAVGAPYDGKDGRGAVYIYHGSATGPLANPSQVIYAENVIGTERLSTFGFSVAGGIDLDGNMYPDLVVGAYDSNKAIVFRSRPVVMMEASTSFMADNKLISLEHKNCTLLNGQYVTCTNVSSCLTYNGKNLPRQIDITVSWVLDSKKQRSPRMFFLYEETKNIRNSTMRLDRGKTVCRNEQVYIADGIRDKLTPLEVEMRYSLREVTTQYFSSTTQRRKRGNLEPILDQNKGTVQRDSINIQKNCGPDNVCIPDLKLEIKTVEKFLLGSRDPLNIDVLISNFGEDAFEAGFYMVVPENLDYKKVMRMGESREIPITCTAPTLQTDFTLKCDIGNPLPAGKVAQFRVILKPANKTGLAPAYEFYMEANSTNVEAHQSAYSDNIIRKSVAIWVDTELSISGNSVPSDVHYNMTAYKDFENATMEAELGPHVVHIYDVRNSGTSTIEEVEVFVMWPHETNADEPLMILMDQPEISGNIKCEPYYLEYDIEVDDELYRKSYLHQGGVAMRNDYSTAHHSTGESWWTNTYLSSSGSRHVGSGRRKGSSSSSSSSSGGVYRKTGTKHVTSTSGGGKIVYTEEEKKILDSEDSQESTGDASLVHIQRGKASSQTGGGVYKETHESRWSQTSQGGGTQGGRRVIESGSIGGGSRISENREQSSGGGRVTLNQGGYVADPDHDARILYNERTQSNGAGSVAYESDLYEDDSDRGSDRIDSHLNSGRTQTETYRRTEEKRISDGRVVTAQTGGLQGSQSQGTRTQQSAYNQGGRTVGGSVGDGSRREFTYERRWNSSSVNGGPAVVHESVRNQSSVDGNVRVYETSTVVTLPEHLAGFGTNEKSSFDASRQNYNERRTGGSSSSSSGSRVEQSSSSDRDYSVDRNRIDTEETVRQRGSQVRGSSGSKSDYRGSNSGSSGGVLSTSRTYSAVNEDVNQDISGLHSRTQQEETTSRSSRRRMMSQQDGQPLTDGLITGATVTSLEKLAQGGRGFQTSGLDVSINTGSVDQEVRKQSEIAQTGGSISGSQSGGYSGASQGSVGGGSQSKSNSSYQYTRTYNSGGKSHSETSGGSSWNTGSSSSKQAQSGSYPPYESVDDQYEYDGEKTYYDDDNAEYEENNNDQNQHYQSYSSHTTSTNKGGPASFKYYPRTRRDIEPDEQLESVLKCSATKCRVLRCLAGPLEGSNGALIALRFRMVAQTLNRLSSENEVKMSTMTVARISKLPYIGEPKEKPIKNHEVYVTAIPDPELKPDVVPLWIVVLSACAGAIILLLLIYLLYKCGFFKRNRPDNSSERQPLNRNGNYHGDEHL